MRVYCAKNYEEASILAADLIAAQILLKPDSVLGLATGSTPIGAYQRLIAKYEAGELDFSQVKTMNLDEYRGLDGENPNGYRYFMNHQLFDHVFVGQAGGSGNTDIYAAFSAQCFDIIGALSAFGDFATVKKIPPRHAVSTMLSWSVPVVLIYSC